MKKSKFYEVVFLLSLAGYFVGSKVMGGREHGVFLAWRMSKESILIRKYYACNDDG
jgi:hypothetical protein